MRRLFLRSALFGLLAPTALAGQATADQARLMFTVGLGQTSGGGTLWSVGRQPFQISSTVIDTLTVSRNFRRSLDVMFSGTYFPNDNLGFSVEAQLLGLATEDECSIRFTQGSTETQQLCRSIRRSERSASAAALSAGLVYRIGSRQPLHPFVRANAGFVVSQQSFLKTSGRIETDSAGIPTGVFSDLTLYQDSDPASLQPYLSFGGGVAAVIGRGYQFRVEVRDNWVRLPAVAGPTRRQGVTPKSTVVGKHFLSFLVGFDIVLERKRGRRY